MQGSSLEDPCTATVPQSYQAVLAVAGKQPCTAFINLRSLRESNVATGMLWLLGVALPTCGLQEPGRIDPVWSHFRSAPSRIYTYLFMLATANVADLSLFLANLMKR